jgi:Flp pilus assembly protein TadD
MTPEDRPTSAKALLSQGKASRAAGRLDDSIVLLRRAVAFNPNDPSAHKHLGISLYNAGDIPAAIASHKMALSLDPKDAESWSNLGIALYAIREMDAAVDSLKKSLEINPQNGATLSNLGVVLMELARWEEALTALRRAEAIFPQSAQIALNLSSLLGILGDFKQRSAYLNRSGQLDPRAAQSPPYHWTWSLIHLSEGNLTQGWQEYEARLQIPSLDLVRNFPQPRWDGSPAPGKKILLTAEGAFGDTLFFSRFVPMIPDQGEKILLEVQPELVDLYSSMSRPEQIIPRGQTPPDFDLQFPLQSLPWLLKVTLDNFQSKVPYLSTGEDRLEKWRHKFTGDDHFKVGLVWAGSVKNQRSYRVENYAPLASIPNVKFYSLQKGPRGADTPPAGLEIIDFMNEVADFADTAAIMHHLDLVISVDSSPVHLAGALGRPVWALVPICPYFTYLLDRSDSPFYPTLRIFRQTKIEQWNEPVAQIAEALNELVRNKKKD